MYTNRVQTKPRGGMQIDKKAGKISNASQTFKLNMTHNEMGKRNLKKKQQQQTNKVKSSSQNSVRICPASLCFLAVSIPYFTNPLQGQNFPSSFVNPFLFFLLVLTFRYSLFHPALILSHGTSLLTNGMCRRKCGMHAHAQFSSLSLQAPGFGWIRVGVPGKVEEERKGEGKGKGRG